MTAKLFIPRPWQPGAIQHLCQWKRAGLFIPPGMGKTSIVLKAANTLDYIDDVFPVLVTAPLRIARDVWSDETKKWTFSEHMNVSPIIGDLDERMDALNTKAHIYTVNPEQVPWLVKLYGKKFPFKTVVADEFSRWKSFRIRQGGARAKELYKVAWLPQTPRFWGLTGSPCSNGVKDLYGMLMYLDQGDRLGRTFTSFTDRWFQRGWDGFSMEPLPFAQEEIENLIKDICLSVRAEDWIEIDKPVRSDIFVTLPPTARKLYNDMERDMFMVIENEGVEAFSAGAKRVKLHQVCQGANYLENGKDFKVVHDEKIKALDSLIEENNGANMIVAYQFKHDLARLQKAFPHGIDLSTDKGLKQFKTGKFSLGFAHPASLGHGVDGLQLVCNILVYFGHGDSLDNYEQILERIGPMRQMQAGMNRPVYVYHIICKDSVEEYAILPSLSGKGTVQSLLMERMRRV